METALLMIGMIAGLGLVLWLFTTDVGHCKVDQVKNVDAFDDGYNLGYEAGGGDNSDVPDEAVESYVKHRDRY